MSVDFTIQFIKKYWTLQQQQQKNNSSSTTLFLIFSLMIRLHFVWINSQKLKMMRWWMRTATGKRSFRMELTFGAAYTKCKTVLSKENGQNRKIGNNKQHGSLTIANEVYFIFCFWNEEHIKREHTRKISRI